MSTSGKVKVETKPPTLPEVDVIITLPVSVAKQFKDELFGLKWDRGTAPAIYDVWNALRHTDGLQGDY